MAELQPIIIKKVKKAAHGHHGGAWKVAYADFVTAMMAFFLLMWLLSATTEEQKMGLADYFSPSLSTTRTGGGGEGLLGGTSVGTTGVQSTQGSPLVTPVDVNTASSEESSEAGDYEGSSGGAYDAEMEKVSQEDAQFDSIAGALQAAIESIPELEELADNIKISITNEGLKIQLIDQENYSMFPSGKATMNDKTAELMSMVVMVMQALNNQISITGHTDAHPFTSRDGYDNWDLSSERANATRRFLVGQGIDTSRVHKVEGKAAIDPYIKEDAYAPQNRRVSITLLRQNKIPKKAAVKDDEK